MQADVSSPINPEDFAPAETPAASPLARFASHPLLPWLVIAIGTLLRLRRYLLDRGVMHDEAELAFNVLTRSVGNLLHPLNLGDQAAPVGFLLLQKLATTLFGPGELAIRAVPFAAAILALPLFYWFVRQLASAPVALAALCWFALAEPLVYYAAEGKQYSTDVLWTIVVLLLAINASTLRRIVVTGIAGAILIWFSHPILFVLGGIGAGMVLSHLHLRRRALLMADLVVGLAWLASFALNYLLISRYYAQSDYLRNYWAERHAFAPLLPHSLPQFRWYLDALLGTFVYPLGLAPEHNSRAAVILYLALIVFVAGCAVLALRRRRALVVLLVTILLCAIASSLHKYPFAERLILFTTPLMILPLAFVMGNRWRAGAGFLALRIALLAALFVYPLYLQVKYAVHPLIHYDVKPAMRYVKSHWIDGDVLYLAWGSDVLGHYYLRTQPAFALPGARIVVGRKGQTPQADVADFRQDLNSLKGQRVWFVFSMGPREEQRAMENVLAKRGRALDSRIYAGGAAELFAIQ